MPPYIRPPASVRFSFTRNWERIPKKKEGGKKRVERGKRQQGRKKHAYCCAKPYRSYPRSARTILPTNWLLLSRLSSHIHAWFRVRVLPTGYLWGQPPTQLPNPIHRVGPTRQPGQITKDKQTRDQGNAEKKSDHRYTIFPSLFPLSRFFISALDNSAVAS